MRLVDAGVLELLVGVAELLRDRDDLEALLDRGFGVRPRRSVELERDGELLDEPRRPWSEPQAATANAARRRSSATSSVRGARASRRGVMTALLGCD